VRKKISSLALCLILVLGACSPSPERINNQGNAAYEQQDYETAMKNYLNAQAKLPELAEPAYNAANVDYRLEDYEAALQRLQGSLQIADGNLAQMGYYNLGNTLYQVQQLEIAIESYKEALRLDPDDMEAKYNLELALQKLQEQQSEGEGDDQQEQDEEGQDEPQPEGQDGEQNEGQQAQDEQQAPQQSGQITPEQATQLLESSAQGTQSLQERLQQNFLVPGSMPDEDW
jgi:Ca-activated chloride channel family protein